MANKTLPALPLQERHYGLLENYSRRRDVGNHELKRIKIILKSSKGQSNYSISREVGLGVEAVSRWRGRWKNAYGALQDFERGKSGEGVSDGGLLKRMLGTLKDRPRPGKPVEITMSQKKQIAALACRKPSEYGIKMGRWTNDMLAEVARTEKIVASISPTYVGRILKKSGHMSAQEPVLAVPQDSGLGQSS